MLCPPQLTVNLATRSESERGDADLEAGKAALLPKGMLAPLPVAQGPVSLQLARMTTTWKVMHLLEKRVFSESGSSNHVKEQGTYIHFYDV